MDTIITETRTLRLVHLCKAPIERVFAAYQDAPTPSALRTALEVATTLGDEEWVAELREQREAA